MFKIGRVYISHTVYAFDHKTTPAIFEISNRDQIKPRLPKLGPQR